MTTFFVNEIYPCLQGEGVNLGVPSVLVRLQICNLRCTWCDTVYTHTYKSDPEARRYPLEELRDQIVSYGIPHVILSGGEPTLQNLGALVRALPATYTFEVETNGTRIPHVQVPGFLESDYPRMQWNVSFKDQNAGQPAPPQDGVAHWAQLSKQPGVEVFFKSVVCRDSCESDLNRVQQWVQEYGISPQRVLLMAEGTTAQSQCDTAWLVEACLRLGYRMTVRLHVLAYGQQRGV